MTSYLVLTPPGGPDSGHTQTRFVRDRFSFLAFLFPGFWLLAKRLWLPGLIVLVLQGLAGYVAEQPGLFFAGTALGLSLSMLVALEGPSLIAAILERKGWTLAGIVVADDLDAAEDIYFNDPATVPASPKPLAPGWTALPSGTARPTGPALGLLDLDGGR